MGWGVSFRQYKAAWETFISHPVSSSLLLIGYEFSVALSNVPRTICSIRPK